MNLEKSTRRVREWNERQRLRLEYQTAAAAFAAENPQLSQEESEWLGRMQVDLGFGCEEVLSVEPYHMTVENEGAPVPFKFNALQQIVDDEVRAQLDERGYVRLVILKSRKAGITTQCLGYSYLYASTRKHRHALVIPHVDEMALKMLNTVKLFHQLDERRQYGFRPALERENLGEILFGNPDKKTKAEGYLGLQSTIEVASAQAKQPGRSGTYHFVEASEVAFWPDTGVWTAAGNAVPRSRDTWIIMESTANGEGGLFHTTYMNAKAGKSDYRALFLRWMDDPNCRAALTSDERQHWDWLSREERDYAETWLRREDGGVDLELAKFRRQRLASPECMKAGYTPEQVFDEEFPASDELAFLSSGSHFFLLSSLKALEASKRGVSDPVQVGEIANRTSLAVFDPNDPPKIEPVFTPNDRGSLLVWEPPLEDDEYVLGGDPAEGVITGDRHCAVVLKRSTLDVVAIWKGNHIRAKHFGEACALLGWWYGTCLVGVEHNAYGLASIEELRRLMYPLLWHHTDVTREGSTPTEKVGWVTSKANRVYTLEALEFEIRSAGVGLHHRGFYEEARNFKRNPKKDNRPEAALGFHDDEIMATAIALQMHLRSGPPRRVPKAIVEAKPRKLVPDRPAPRIRAAPLRMTRRVHNRGLWGFDE